MASIEKNLNSSNGSSGIHPWSLTNPGNGGAYTPSSEQSNGNSSSGVLTSRPGATGQKTLDMTQQSETTSAHPNNAAGAGVDNTLHGACNTRLDVNGPANTGQGADVATYGAADPLSKQGYSILGE